MSHQSANPVRRVGVATVLTSLGVLLGVLLSIPALAVSLSAITQFAVALVLSELGFVAAALLFLRVTATVSITSGFGDRTAARSESSSSGRSRCSSTDSSPFSPRRASGFRWRATL
jgi:hypothetical protein